MKNNLLNKNIYVFLIRQSALLLMKIEQKNALFFEKCRTVSLLTAIIRINFYSFSFLIILIFAVSSSIIFIIFLWVHFLDRFSFNFLHFPLLLEPHCKSIESLCSHTNTYNHAVKLIINNKRNWKFLKITEYLYFSKINDTILILIFLFI